MEAARPTEPFRRLIIYHSGLLPDSTDGLDESASLEELCEHILYYFDSSYGTSGGRLFNNVDDRIREDAVKFVGLVSALHSLPSSLNRAICSSGDETERETGSTSATSTCAPALHTDHVYLSTSTIVFIPLEEEHSNNRGLVAVAQLPRVGPASMDKNSTGALGGGDPVAIRAMIRRKHAMFCLFHGGSVHYRLMALDQSQTEVISNTTEETDNDERSRPEVEDEEPRRNNAAFATSVAAATCEDAAESSSDEAAESDHCRFISQEGGQEARAFLRQQSRSYVPADSDRNASSAYPGMPQLYAYRKKYRKLNEQLTRTRIDAELYDQGSANVEERLRSLEKRVSTAQEDVNALLRILPVSTIRAALSGFYDEMIVNASHKRSLAGECIGRCIVDLVPAPSLSCPLRSCFPLCEPPPSTAATLSRFMRSLLQRCGQQGRSLFGVEAINAESDFVPILAITSFYCGRYLYSNVVDEGDDVCRIDSSHETVSLIHQYLCRHRMRRDVEIARDEVDNAEIDKINRGRRGVFMRPPLPPNSNAIVAPGTAERSVESLRIEALGNVWMPRVVLPLLAQGEAGKRVHVGEKAARVAFVEYRDYDFIIFVNGAGLSTMKADTTSLTTVQRGQSHELRASEIVTSALVSLSNQLQDNLHRICIDASNNLTAGMREEEDAQGQAGVDMLFIDRLANTLILFNNGVPMTGPIRKAVGVTANEPGPSSHTSRNDVVHDYSSFLVNCEDELDCRHLLASHLPLDIVLALDEMMKEIRQSCSSINADGSRVTEICTFSPQGWVYCRAAMHRELYAVFDPKLFVTLADVQKKALQIRKDLGLSLL